MKYQDLSKKELIEELRKVNHELQEAHELIQAIQGGEIDAVIVNRDNQEKIYVLEDANVTYRKMIEEMNEGAVTFSSDFSVLYCNKAFANILKYNVDEVTSKPVGSFVNPDFHEVFGRFLNQEVRDPIRTSLMLLDKSGNNIPVMISLHKIEMAGMQILMMTVTDEREKQHIKKLGEHQKALEKLNIKLRDAKVKAEQAVSLLKEKNIDYTILNEEYININKILTKTIEELVSAKGKAEKSDRLKSAFIANMSHEIRTPLNSILGYTKMLVDSVDDPEQKKHIHVIIRSGKHLLSLIDDIVDLSRLESGEMKITESAVGLKDMMEDLKGQLHAYAVNKGKEHIELRLQLPGDKWNGSFVMADEFRVRQVLNNLLSNALKYTDQGFIEFGYDISGPEEKLLFYVRDTGVGISNNDLKIIFNRFEQGRAPSNKVVSGTGLGLAIAKGLTELLGGKIWVESTPGEGSVFYFTLPFKKADSEISRSPVKKEIEDTGIPKLEGKRILLSEDDLFSREMMIYILNKTGAELMVAKDGREALDIFDNNQVDLVLLDIRLPEVDGYQVLRHIREKKPETIVIAQTAYAMMEDIRKFKDSGFNDYLLKPVNDNELYGVLHKYLD